MLRMPGACCLMLFAAMFEALRRQRSARGARVLRGALPSARALLIAGVYGAPRRVHDTMQRRGVLLAHASGTAHARFDAVCVYAARSAMFALLMFDALRAREEMPVTRRYTPYAADAMRAAAMLRHERYARATATRHAAIYARVLRVMPARVRLPRCRAMLRA